LYYSYLIGDFGCTSYTVDSEHHQQAVLALFLGYLVAEHVFAGGCFTEAIGCEESVYPVFGFLEDAIVLQSL
jgi:hypothetical protein